MDAVTQLKAHLTAAVAKAKAEQDKLGEGFILSHLWSACDWTAVAYGEFAAELFAIMDRADSDEDAFTRATDRIATHREYLFSGYYDDRSTSALSRAAGEIRTEAVRDFIKRVESYLTAI